jgi:hypothetical protein
MFEVKIDTDNAAFDPNPDLEVARILERVASELRGTIADQACGFSMRLLDVNGNAVGAAGYTD